MPRRVWLNTSPKSILPVSEQRIVVVCGKGNNGGDGLAIARQLHVRFHPRHLWVVLTARPDELTGDAAANLKMLQVSGVQEYRDFGPEMRAATLVIDAVLGTGLNGPARGAALDAIREINSLGISARVIAVDIPSGLAGDSGMPPRGVLCTPTRRLLLPRRRCATRSRWRAI